jgi:hypothetical protein
MGNIGQFPGFGRHGTSLHKHGDNLASQGQSYRALMYALGARFSSTLPGCGFFSPFTCQSLEKRIKQPLAVLVDAAAP